MASPPPAPPAPVGEDSWLDYVDQQRRNASTLEQWIRIVELYRSAVNAEPGSLRVWIAYCTYFWSLYIDCAQCRGPVAAWPPDEQAAAAEIFSLDAALHLWNEGHEATQFRLSDSHELWNRWIALERELLDRTRTAEGVRRITHLYRNRLAIPHAAWDETSSAFSSFLSEYNPAAYEDTMRAVTEQSRRARSIYDRRDGMEMALRAADRAGDEQARREAMSNYLDWETANAHAQSDPADKLLAVRVALGLFSRALTGIFQTDDGVWTDMVVFVSQVRGDLAEVARDTRESSENRDSDELARCLPNSLDVLQRAVRHCPWSGLLWARYIVCGEQVGLSFSAIERIKHAATNSSLDRDGMTAVVEMYAAWCGYLRRSAMDSNASDEAVDLADSGLVAALEAVQVWGERRFGSAFQGDPNYRLERIMIQHLTDKHGAIDEARAHWEKLAAKDLHANDYSFWLSYYEWEMSLFQAQKAGHHHRSPTPATAAAAAAMRVPSLATRVLRRALQNLHLNWPERVIEIYVNHCNDYQTADGFCDALDDTHKLQKLLTKHRREAMALQAAQQVQEAEARQQTERNANAYTTPDEAASADAMQDSPPSAKRKRKAEAADGSGSNGGGGGEGDDSIELAAKRARNESTAALKRDRENTSVFVENLPADVTSTKLRQYFRAYGHVNNIQLQKEEDGRTTVALVEFRTVEDVQSALIRDGKYYGDRVITVRPAVGVTLFLTNFPPTADDAYLHELFRKCGPIFGIRWPSLKFNAHRRFCYMSFREAASAAKAAQLDGRLLEGRYRLSAKYSDPTRKKSREGAVEEGREVHVRNLSPDMDEKGLEELFGRYGRVERVRLLRNIGGRSRGSGFVVFEAAEEAQQAVAELDKVKMGARILEVDLSRPSQYKPTAREASVVSETGSAVNGEQQTNGDGQKSESNTPSDRTFALLGIPDTVSLARVRALAEPYGHIVKLVLRANHGGAIVEYADAAAAGKAQLALTGAQLDGHKLRTGAVGDLFREKAPVRVDRVDQAVRSAPTKETTTTAAAAPATETTAATTKSMVPHRVKRPALGSKGAKRGVGIVAPAAAAGVAAAGKAAASGENGLPAKKSNAEFRALFLGGRDEAERTTNGH